MTDIAYPLFPFFAFLGFIVSLIPLPWHLQAWNSGTCYFIMWASLSCLNQSVNSVVWSGNALNHSPIWCEISIRILMGSSVGLPAASLCINRRLYHIASGQSVNLGHAQKSRAILVDTMICVLFPLLYVALQYVVQGHRFNIFEDIGCYPALYNTLPTYFISCMWPIIIGVISATYCTLSLCAFSRRRLAFSQFLRSNASSLSTGRYFRLMALAMTDILLTTPLAIFNIYLNTAVSPIGPWISWEDTHFAYSRIEQIPAIMWKRNHILVISMELTRWLTPLCAFIFFGFFGFADEAKRNYRRAISWIAKPLRLDTKKAALPSHDDVSIAHFKTSKLISPYSEKSFQTASTSLPPFSPPPPSFTPVYDIKPLDSVTTQHTPLSSPTIYDTNSSCMDMDETSIGSCTNLHPVPGLDSRRNATRFTIPFIPYSSRRHSSYF